MIQQGYRKVLVIKLCCIGDIIQTTPALRALKDSGTEVHFLCNRWASDVVDMVPFVSKKYVMDHSSIVSLAGTIGKLRAEKYDLVINFHRDLKSYIFAAMLGSKYRAGFNWKGQGMFLTHPFVFDEKAHEGKRYLSVVEGLGYKASGINTGITPRHKPATDGGRVKIGFFPGGGKNPGTVMTTKRWPVEKFVKLAAGLKKYEIYIFGGKTDADVTAPLLSEINGSIPVVTKDLKELADAIADMDVFIAGDTGPLHMSAALGVNTVGLFGPSSPELVGPPGEHAVNIWGRTGCAPCYVPGNVYKKEFLKCKDNICMKSISTDEVRSAVEKLLASSGRI
jgi:ADP-heptose:LPS heptosyltransferase